MSHHKDINKQCEHINESGERCVNAARQGSIYCRRCELKIQKKFHLLEYPKQDFFETHKPPAFAKPLAFITFLGFSLFIFPSALGTSYFGIIELIKLPLTSETLLIVLMLAIRGLFIVAIYFLALFQMLAEIAKSSERKYLHRTRLYKLIGLIIFPLLTVYLLVLLLLGHANGWDKATSSDWFTMAGLIIFIYYSSIIFFIIRKPLLYFRRELSVLLDLSMIAMGIFIFFQPRFLGLNTDNRLMEIMGVLGASFGLGMLNRTISGKETLAQQIIVQIYRLPALLQTFVSSDQRRLALAIGLGQFQNLTSLQKEELINYLVDTHKPTIKEKIISGLKFVLITFFVALLIESPASYIFGKIIESLQTK